MVHSDIRSALSRRNSLYLLIASFHSYILAADASIHKLNTIYKHVNCYYGFPHFSICVTLQFDLVYISQTCVKHILYCNSKSWYYSTIQNLCVNYILYYSNTGQSNWNRYTAYLRLTLHNSLRCKLYLLL